MDTERDLEKALDYIANQISENRDHIHAEVGTIQTLILPFISDVLGYDSRNAQEVKREYIASVRKKKTEKVDIAILDENKPLMFLECKKFGEVLTDNHRDQLRGYFVAKLEMHIAILTNGQIYKFYTDIDEPNIMDDEPFLSLDILDRKPIDSELLKKLTKEEFNIETITRWASDLKYKTQIIEIIKKQIVDPKSKLVQAVVKVFFQSPGYLGKKTEKISIKKNQGKKIESKFSKIVADAFQLYLDGGVKGRPQSSANANENNNAALSKGAAARQEKINKARDIVRTIVGDMIKADRVEIDTVESYYTIIIDKNKKQRLCRFRLYPPNKYPTTTKISFFDAADKEGKKHSIESLEEIYQFKKEICDTAQRYR